MTNKEAIKMLNKARFHDMSIFDMDYYYNALEMAIAALKGEGKTIDAHYMKGFSNGIRTEKFRASKQELCEDAVSREAVMQALTKLGYGDEENGANAEYMSALWDVAEKVKALPPVTPKPKTGKWIKLQHNSDGTSRYMCSECGDTMQLSRHTFATFRSCPKCGAKMGGESE